MNDRAIILFTSSFPFGKGEQFIETELGYLSGAFSKVFVFPYYYGGNTESRIKSAGHVKVFTPFRNDRMQIFLLLFKGLFNKQPLLPYLKDILLHPFILIKPALFSLWLRSLLNCRMILNDKRLNNCIRENRNDLIFYFYWGNRPLGISEGLKKFKRPIVARFHRVDLYRELPINRNYIPFQELILKNLSHAVCISTHGKNYLENRFREKLPPISVHRLGTHNYGNNHLNLSNTLRIVSCSGVDENKQVHVIAEAVSLLDFPVSWTHIGDGPLMEDLRQLCSTVQKKNITIKLAGRYTNSEVHSFYCGHPIDLFINVSKSEGVPFSIMEALSYSIPVFATPAGGTPEIINSSCGKLLPENASSRTLAEQLVWYYSLSDTERNELRANARIRWEELCSAENNYSKFVAFLQKLG